MRLLFLVRRVGPYHDARFEAAGQLLELTVCETRPETREYPWTTQASARAYRLRRLGTPSEPDRGLRGSELKQALEVCLSESSPDVIACTGWADPEYHVALSLCSARGIPAIVMTDSTKEDEPRRWWKEFLKSRIICSFAAAVVAGTRSRTYLRELGFPEDRIFEPWDVVDNGHFSTRIGRAGGLPQRPYFLCVSRYLPKKNLLRLVSAYATYRGLHGPDAWDLVILGSGELENRIRGEVAAAGLVSQVHLPGFVQYGELPAYYSGAGAAVLPSVSDQWGLAINEAMAAGLPVIVSRACGCALDLVAEGSSGFTFDPTNASALSGLLLRVASSPPAVLKSMGEEGKARVAAYSVARFAEALRNAARCAARHSRRPDLATRMLLVASELGR